MSRSSARRNLNRQRGDPYAYAYNAIVPVDVSEAFKQRAADLALRLENERQTQERDRKRLKDEAIIREKRLLVHDWVVSCITACRTP